MSRGVRVAVSLLAAWILWMLVKIPLGNGFEALAVFVGAGVLVWLVTGVVAGRLAERANTGGETDD